MDCTWTNDNGRIQAQVNYSLTPSSDCTDQKIFEFKIRLLTRDHQELDSTTLQMNSINSTETNAIYLSGQLSSANTLYITGEILLHGDNTTTYMNYVSVINGEYNYQ